MIFNWKTMESAPTNGEPILLRFKNKGNGKVCVGFWSDRFGEFVDSIHNGSLIGWYGEPIGWLSLRDA